jgi:ABC-type bacteriocin/lantibiotic exporter with double-glycine peptidase domain
MYFFLGVSAFVIVSCGIALQMKSLGDFFDERSKTQSIIDKQKAIYNVWTSLFMKRIKTKDEMNELNTDIIVKDDALSRQWIFLNLKCMMPWFVVYSSLLISTWSYNVAVFMLVVKLLNEFVDSVGSFYNFVNNFNQYETDYTKYIEFFDDKKMENNDMIKEPFPTKLVITQSTEELNCYNIKFNFDTLEIPLGSVIKLKGPSGHGKTTTLNRLLGYEPGFVFTKSSPKALEHHWTFVSQNLHQFFDLNLLNIKELFSCDNEKHILELCKVCCIDKKVKEIGFTNVIGEKSRLITATQLVNCEKSNGLIFDEPETGSDLFQALDMIQNIITKYKQKTIIIVTHLEKTDKIKEWTHYLNIVDGVLSVSLTYC